MERQRKTWGDGGEIERQRRDGEAEEEIEIQRRRWRDEGSCRETENEMGKWRGDSKRRKWIGREEDGNTEGEMEER